MRSDVKLGFAIGGVLLAVLIVYVLVVPGGTSQTKKVSQATGGTSANGQGSGQNSGLSKSNGAVAGGTDGHGGVTFEPVAGAATQGVPAIPPPSYDPKLAQAKTAQVKTAQGVKPDSGKSTDPFAKGDELVARATPAAPPVTPRGGDLDWNKLLNEQPVLMTETPVATGAKTQTTGGATAVASVQPPIAEPIAAGSASGTDPSSSSAASASPFATPEIASAAATSQPSIGAPVAGSRTHVIQAGETLSSISTAAYGNSKHYPAIIKANPGVDPSHLKVGQTINLPDLALVRPSVNNSADAGPVASSGASSGGGSAASAQHASARIPASVDPTREYRVQAGDSLYKISVHLYGRGDHAEKIYQANKQSIGDDPHRLKVGQVLTLPEAPTVNTASATH